MEGYRDPEIDTRPRDEITLRDGQRLQAAVVHRRRDRVGGWWYARQIEIPACDEAGHNGAALTSRVISFSAPYPSSSPCQTRATASSTHRLHASGGAGASTTRPAPAAPTATSTATTAPNGSAAAS